MLYGVRSGVTYLGSQALGLALFGSLAVLRSTYLPSTPPYNKRDMARSYGAPHILYENDTVTKQLPTLGWAAWGT
jgi:hypothetical protein